MKNKKFAFVVEYSLKKLLQHFLQGLIVLAPIGITIYVILSLFRFVDSILPNILEQVVPSLIQKDYDGNLKKMPGLGFLVVIVFVLLVGRVSSSFVVKKLVEIFDVVLENTPGIKFIYTSVKDFLEAFAGNKKKFDMPVLVNVDAENVWRLGFVTQEDALALDLLEHVVVYVPHSYAISGITFIVPLNKVKPLKNKSAADVMKFAISGGVTELEN